MATKGPVYWLYSEIHKSLGLRVSLKQLKDDYGDLRNTTLFQIQEQLADWNVKSMGVSLKSDHLDRIPLPAILHRREKSNEFLILKGVTSDSVRYLRYEHGELTVPRSEFISTWTGAALLLEANEKSGDPQYAGRRVQEIWKKGRELAIAALLGVLLIRFGLVWPDALLPLAFNIVGLAVCVTLFLKSIGVDTLISQSACRQGTRTDCNLVIHSRLGNLFGAIQISEIGLLFFGSNLLGELHSLITTGHQNLMVGYLCICAIPITLFLVFYQGIVAKSWCVLCLVVSGVVWILGVASLPSTLGNWPTFQDIAIQLTSSCVSLLLWLLVRPQVLSASQSKLRYYALRKFRRSRELFDALLNRQPAVDPEITTGDVVIGNENAVITVTLVTSPTCGPCVIAHEFFDLLYNNYSPNLRLVYRFAVSAKENGSVANRVSQEIVNLGVLNKNNLHEAIRAWYGLKRPSLDEWIKAYSLPKNELTAAALNKHETWCVRNGIRATPMIFIQGRKISELYTMADIAYFLQQDLVNVKVA